jgi:hypothetical protein
MCLSWIYLLLIQLAAKLFLQSILCKTLRENKSNFEEKVFLSNMNYYKTAARICFEHHTQYDVKEEPYSNKTCRTEKDKEYIIE